jgi:hypothetical protein
MSKAEEAFSRAAMCADQAQAAFDFLHLEIKRQCLQILLLIHVNSP